ncbi:MAG TPA: SGNH/GDSL hydrolase family protein [Acidimicrobiales bacterium]|nr:SGNH/GDSL hydrolase family protein [Acidimicrobiales bacterium]
MRRLLFAGDSITDCGRTFFDPDVAAGHLGDGWVRIVAALLGRRFPGVHEVRNAGVSGDRVADLLARWERDVAAFAPHVLTVLVGVNDSLLEPRTPDAELDRALRTLLGRVPASVEQLVVAEPFVLPVDARTEAVRAAALPHRALIRQAAEEAGATVLPLWERFDEAARDVAPTWWAHDGIHPTPAGHALIAETWLDALADHLP